MPTDSYCLPGGNHWLRSTVFPISGQFVNTPPRGVYELAGRQASTSASDLFDREIFYELTPRIIIPGRAMASRLQGKPRIRLDDTRRTTHLYRLLAAVLLLPKPKREFKKTHGRQLLKFEAYSMSAIKVDVAETDAHSVVLRPTDLLLENAASWKRKLFSRNGWRESHASGRRLHGRTRQSPNWLGGSSKPF